MGRIPVEIIFGKTIEFLEEGLRAHGVANPKVVLDCYKRPKPATEKSELLKRLIDHSYNRQMGQNVIGAPIRNNRAKFVVAP